MQFETLLLLPVIHDQFDESEFCIDHEDWRNYLRYGIVCHLVCVIFNVLYVIRGN